MFAQNPEQDHTQLVTLYQLVRQIQCSINLDEVLQHTLHGTQSVSHAQLGCLILLDDQGMPGRWMTSDDTLKLTTMQVQSAIRDGVQCQALSRQQIFHVDDTLDYETLQPHLLPGRSLLIIPLHTEHGAVGVLTLAHQEPRIFDHTQIALLTEAAESIALAIHHARLYTGLLEEKAAYEESKYKLLHDIRSPLTAVSASLDVIKRALKLQPAHASIHELLQESLDSGQRSLQAVLTLTGDLLDTRRLQISNLVLEHATVSLELLCDDVSKMLHGVAIQRQAMLRYQVTPRTLTVSGDVHLLRRLLVNLTSNALRFTPVGGSVTIKAYENTERKQVMLVVEDTGPGVKPEDRERIFQPFVQGKGEENRGTGLGLSICREIAHAHDGQIWVEDRPSRGSRFCVALPSTVEHSG